MDHTARKVKPSNSSSVVPPMLCAILGAGRKCLGFGKCEHSPAPYRCSHPKIVAREKREAQKRQWRKWQTAADGAGRSDTGHEVTAARNP